MSVRFSFRQLEYLVAVADAGSISAAAQLCHASQGGVSQALSDLEQRLGVQLLSRRKAKKVSLTDAGSRVLGDARRLLEAADELALTAHPSQNEISGTLSLGCYSTLAPFVIPPVLDDLAGRHPALEVQVVEGAADEILTALMQGCCEIACLYSNDVRGELATVPIRTTRPYIILAADHPLAAREEIRLADIADEPLIMFDVPSARNAAQLLGSAGLTARIRHLSSNIEVVRSLVARGLGYSILVQRWPINVSYEGNPLVARPIADHAPAREVVLTWQSESRQTRRATALLEFCRSTFSNVPAAVSADTRD